MASSNRHWPSMFKSKPCNTHHQWQHDTNQSLIPTGCHRTPYTSVSKVTGCEERSPEPKPRWNPKPEQIRILEEIFNSGMVNPPRDEIRKIRAQLQEFGQVGDANVFYWFQNRKSRSKHKLRHLQNSKRQQQMTHNHNNIHQNLPNNFNTTITTAAAATTTNITITPSSSSSSSSEKSSPKAPTRPPAFSIGFSEALNSPTASVSQSTAFFHTNTSTTHDHFLAAEQPFFSFPVHHQSSSTSTQGFCYTHELIPNAVHNFMPSDHYNQQIYNVGPCTSLLPSEIMDHHGANSKKLGHDHHDIELQDNAAGKLQLNYTPSTAAAITSPAAITTLTTAATTTSSSKMASGNQIQGVGEEGSSGVGPVVGGAKTTVFINDVAFDVPAGRFNVREAFGEEAVLIHSNGQPVLTNEWGLTLHSLHHGAFYYLI